MARETLLIAMLTVKSTENAASTHCSFPPTWDSFNWSGAMSMILQHPNAAEVVWKVVNNQGKLNLPSTALLYNVKPRFMQKYSPRQIIFVFVEMLYSWPSCVEGVEVASTAEDCFSASSIWERRPVFGVVSSISKDSAKEAGLRRSRDWDCDCDCELRRGDAGSFGGREAILCSGDMCV